MNEKRSIERWPKFWRLMVLMLLSVGLWPAGRVTADLYNPQPAEGDLVLPMPGEGGMVFRPVHIGEGNRPFALHRFKVGDPNGGFKESPTTVVIGGAFIGKRQGNPDWLYYMGKFEVTESQYYSIMDPPAGDSPALKSSQLPIGNVSWFDANTFVNRYNEWLFANAVDKLPQAEGTVSFVRLPTEIEWEFAARGGVDVTTDDFDRRIPYSGNPAEYEWFAGPKSSHNKPMKVGLLKPNPLKLHDMIGNVSEMTHSLYQIEYYQGRTGGFVSRGGHFLSSESELRSSLRTEQPFYIGDSKQGKVRPNRKPTMGFRLVLSTVIYSSPESVQQLQAAWEEYRGSKGAALPAGLSVGPVSAKTDVQREDAFAQLARLKKALMQGGALPDSAKEELGQLETSLGEIRFIRKQAEEDSAYAWAKIAAEQGFFIFRELRKLPTLDQLTAIAEKAERTSMVEKYRERRAELVQNIEQALTTYSDSLRQLATISPPVVAGGFDRYLKFLMERNAAEQVLVLKTVREHFSTFAREHRADPDRWKSDLTRIGR
ncbi:MAG TPA: SUMF1/EgtB/PvdO family nonheme iron enzyme [Syntrophobacteraceae bacterium]|nr:SUMF1/EgtB/PvdO family nonheme iron enzyme [Syntrophobacteraceae bacterium]